MKIKMAAAMLLCSVAIMCSDVSASGSTGQLLQSADCGCGAAPVVEDCGCGAAADDGCGCRRPVRGLLSKLRSGGCGCGGGCGATAVPAPVADCGCDVAPVADCGCDAAPSCGCRGGKGLKGFFERVGGQVPSDCGCGPTCEPAPVAAPSCGCAQAAPVADCGCDAAPAAAPSCGCKRGGLLGRLRSLSCGCGSRTSASNFGGAYEPVVAPIGNDCGCNAAPAPMADCGCGAAPAPAAAPSCGCGSGGCLSGGLLGRLSGRGCGCGSAAAPAPAVDCGCDAAPAPAADCGCGAAPAAAPSCGGGLVGGGLLSRLGSGGCGCGSGAPAGDCGCGAGPAPAPSCGGQLGGGLLSRLGSGGCGCGSGAPAGDCGCGAAPASSFGGGAVGSSCGCDGAASGGFQLGQRLRGGCNRCGRSSCNGGCRNRGGVTLLNKLRGDRIVRDTSNCGRCMPACPNQGNDSGCGCSSCGDAGVIYDYAPSMQVAPAVQPMAPVAVPATTEGTVVPSAVVPSGAMKKIQPVVDSAAFILRNQK